MWTEILNENFCVTHVGDMHVVTAIGDVTEEQVREIRTYLEEQAAVEHQREQIRVLSEQIEQQRKHNEILSKHGVDLTGNVATHPNW